MVGLREAWDNFLVKIGVADVVYEEDEKVSVQKNNVTPMRKRTEISGGEHKLKINEVSSQIIIVKPSAYNQVETINKHLKSEKAVIINLESVDLNLANRIRDFVYGSVDMVEGNIAEVSDNIIIVTPGNFNIDTGKSTDNSYKRWLKKSDTSTFNYTNFGN